MPLPNCAEELMRMKLAFAFYRIRPSEELLQPVHVEGEGPAKVRNGVTVERIGLNVFRIAYGGELRRRRS